MSSIVRLTPIVGSVIPFAPIAISIIKLIAEQTKKELNLLECVFLVSQAAYLESLQTILQEKPELVQQIGASPASDAVVKLIKKLGEEELEEREAKKAIAFFHESKLAQAFNEILQQRLEEAGLGKTEARILTEQVARKTNEYMLPTLLQTGDKVKQLVEWYSVGGKEELEKHLSIEEYLEEYIKSKPDENIFDETNITFRDLYVPLQVRPINENGQVVGQEKFDIEEWVTKILTSEEKNPKILFIQGEAGRGKSVFSRMFADKVRELLHPYFTPILIRLRDLRVLANNFTETLENSLETVDFVQHDGWLTDKKTRFLFLLDGFDELLLEGRSSGGLEEFLQQIEMFQNNSHHRFLVTGRPLALQGIERLLSQRKGLERVEIQQMNDSIRQIWLNKWAIKVGIEETNNFQQFLTSCPKDIKDNLAREPLLLYLLARMHREQYLNFQMFTGAEGITAKILIYDESIKWVIEKQREDENLRLAGLDSQDLRRFLTEVALCVVQSGNESTNVKMLESRLKDNNDPVAQFIHQAREKTSLEKVKEEKVLNNLLTAFYIKPASGKNGGSMEFVHKSFGEFLCAERLVESFVDWTSQITKRQRQEDSVSTQTMDKQVYDLLGYGNLTPEIVEYLMGLLARNSEFNSDCWLKLFTRLENFYFRWCDGEFIDAPVDANWPLFKKERLKQQLSERENHLGLRQVDAYTGLNILILLFQLYRYAQLKDDLKDKIAFHPCLQSDKNEIDRQLFLKIIGYTQCLGAYTYSKILGLFLTNVNLRKADLSGINLSGADLRGADLSGTDLSGADLSHTNLSGAYLCEAYLSGTYFNSADLSGANLCDGELIDVNFNHANLRGAYLSGANFTDTEFDGADLNGADLNGADLSGTKLNVADLSGANLSCADLSCADLSGANLNGVKLNGAYLVGANLSGANLRILWDGNTKWANAVCLHETINVPPELAQEPAFSAAVSLSKGISLVKEGKVEEAIQSYNQALSIDSNLEISDWCWNILGRYGSLYGHAADVIYACENAVTLEPNYKDFQDSLGLAKALSGDLAGALITFETSVACLQIDDSEDVKQRRLRWIEALKAGENPFTPEELKLILKAES